MTRRPAELASTSAAGASDINALPDPVTLILELNHRVKNNFQIIVSLMNLLKRAMPADRREDTRFIEEHVQSMSVAYRLVYATGSMTEGSLTELISEVLSGLRQIAAITEEHLRVEVPATEAFIGLDHAIALALYLAVLVPPYLDEAVATAGVATVTVAVAARFVTVSVGGGRTTPIHLDFLRTRLMRAYAAQLKAEQVSATVIEVERIRFMLERPVRLPAD